MAPTSLQKLSFHHVLSHALRHILNRPHTVNQLLILCISMLMGVGAGLLSVATANAADAIRVKTVAAGSGDGSSWENAATLQNALQNLADPGDEVWVSTGVYTPGITITDTFSLPAGIALYGGFAGVETDRTQRDWEANPTVLSGDIDGDDVVDANGVVTDTDNITGDNSYHVVTADGTITPITSATVLDGFTVTGGNAVYPIDLGGGMLCNGADGGECSPTIANTTFSGNKAVYVGGALLNNGNNGVSSPTLTNVTFFANEAESGGALFNEGRSGGDSSPILTSVVFSANKAGYGGGAMVNNGSPGGNSTVLANVTFSGNQAYYGGALYSFSEIRSINNPILTNVTFSGNWAYDAGGAIYNRGEKPTIYSNGTNDNEAASINHDADGKLNTILNNVILWGNDAITGVQMANESAGVTITTSLIQGGVTGSGVYNDPDSTVTDGGGNLAGGPADDPLFVEPVSASAAPTTTGNLRQQFGSPVIDVGDNSAITLTTDLDGNPRKMDGNGDGSVIVDLGAYEALAYYPLTLAYGGRGDGGIVAAPKGRTCTSPCVGSYQMGTVVTLKATAGLYSSFSAWSGDVVGTSNPITVTMDASKHVTGTFIAAGSVKGLVVDEDGNPLQGVTVTLNSDSVQSSRSEWTLVDTTDVNGAYRFDDLLAGKYTLTFTKSGYEEPDPLTADVKEGQAVTEDDVVMVRSGGETSTILLPCAQNAP